MGRVWFSHEQRLALLALWRRVPPQSLFALLLLMIWVGLTEGVGVLLLVPLLGVLGGTGPAPAWVKVLLLPLHGLGVVPNAAVLLALFVLLVGLRALGQYGRDELGTVLQHKVVDGLRKDCFDALIHAEWRWMGGKSQADHANLLLTDVNRIGVGLHFGIGLLATLATAGVWCLSALFLSWSMTLIALGGAGLLLLSMSGQRRAAVNLGVNLGEANRALQANVQDALQGIRLAKILGSESRHLDFFVETVQSLRQQQLAFTSSTHRVRSWIQVAGAVLLAVFLYVGLMYGHVPVAALLILVLIFARLIPLLMTAQQQFHHGLHAWPALQDTQRLLADCVKHAEPVVAQPQPVWRVRQDIRLAGVTVHYPGREQGALNGVTLVLPAKTTTALMGASGSGKSTVADVVMGLLMPDEGAVVIDGQMLDATNRMRWRRSVAYVSQEVFLFRDTVRNNLLLACPQASEAECWQALKIAAAEFVLNLPHGLDTLVGDGGVRLSGGERQRIALARALLGQPSLLILDEATSALDTDNEARIRQAIEAMHGQVTTLIIGHRLPTLAHADQVVRLSEGCVLAQGSWAQMQDTFETRAV